jgi:peptide/nickel transport system permease protein
LTELEQSAPQPLTGYLDFAPGRSFGGRVRKAGSMARRNKLGALGVVLVIFVLTVAVGSPLLQRYDEQASFQTANPQFNPTASPLEIAANPNLSAPATLDRWESPFGWKHWLGTDQFGRDIYARLVGGAPAVIIGVGAS